MRIGDFFRIFYHNIKNQIGRLALLLASLAVLIVPIICMFTACDLEIDYKQGVVEEEYAKSGTYTSFSYPDNNIRYESVEQSLAKYQKIKQVFDGSKLEYEADNWYRIVKCQGYEIKPEPFVNFKKQLTFQAEQTVSEENLIYISSEAYKLLKGFGFEVGDIFNVPLKFNFEGQKVEKPINKVIAGVYQENTLEFFMPIEQYIKTFGTDGRMSFWVKENSKTFAEIQNFYSKVESKLKKIAKESKQIANVSVLFEIGRVNISRAIYYLVVGVLSAILFSVAINNLLTTLNISFMENQRSFSIFKALGMSENQKFLLLMCEALMVVLLAFLLSVAITALLGSPLVSFANSFFGSAIEGFAMPWITISVLFAGLVAVTLIFVGIKILISKRKAGMSLLRGIK